MTHRTTEELDAGLDHIRDSPSDHGTVDLIVRRPAVGEREQLEVAEPSLVEGVVGDTWQHRPSRQTEDGGPHPEMQLNLINARAIAHISPDPDRRALAGDQLHLDLDLSADNLPPGTRLALGTAVIEVTAQPHNGCAKFSERFGIDAVRWVNSPEGKRLHLRGINAKVVQPGTVRPGDTVTKVAANGDAAHVSAWGIRTYGDPCRECGYTWDLDLDGVLALVAATPGRYATLLAGCDGAERHPELTWPAVAYVCHVGDNLRIWAERLAGLALGADGPVGGYDENELAAARRYPEVALPGALWSLRSAAIDWQAAVAMAADADVVLVHPDRGAMPALDAARGTAHDAHHHGWDLERIRAA